MTFLNVITQSYGFGPVQFGVAYGNNNSWSGDLAVFTVPRNGTLHASTFSQCDRVNGDYVSGAYVVLGIYVNGSSVAQSYSCGVPNGGDDVTGMSAAHWSGAVSAGYTVSVRGYGISDPGGSGNQGVKLVNGALLITQK